MQFPLFIRPHVRVHRPVIGLTIAALVSACGARREGPDRGLAFRGVALTAPIARPSFTLTDFDGKPFDFVRETDNKVALLFFGYTHCPDVCPLHMANIAAVLKQMPWDERALVKVVFVTTDPERDTPRRLKEWLGQFDPAFVGLTGTAQQITNVMKSLGLGPAQREYVNGDSVNYFVAHAAQVYAFARDGNAYLVYPFGIRQEDWANDLPLLARDSAARDLRRDLAAAARANAVQVAQPPGSPPNVSMGGLTVTKAVIAEPPAMTEAALYLVIQNDTPQSDTLVAVASDVSVRAEMHESMGAGGGMQGMAPAKAIPLPAHSTTRLAPGGQHVMLMTLRRKLAAGDSATVYLSLSHFGSIEARAYVVKYTDLARALP